MKTFTLFATLMLLSAAAFAQPLPVHEYSQGHEEWYLGQAAERLPGLYKKGAYDSIEAYINVTAKATSSLYIFATRILINIQLNKFNDSIIKNPYFLDTLQRYAYIVNMSRATTPDVGNEPGNRLEDMPYEDRLLLFNAAWARLLPQSNQLDSTQVLLCNVIAGKIQNPMAEILKKRKEYPLLDSLFKEREIVKRNSKSYNLAFGTGLWVPQGNALRLGVHPALNLAFGGRSKWGELNLAISLRFGRTPTDYLVLRNDSLYSRHYYLGGYIALEYTRYFYHTLHFEAGVTAGVGYDTIDFANDSSGDDNSSSSNNDYLKPVEIGSLNLNAGLRVNYFFNAVGYIGLEGKFNNIHYHNTGGSPIDGNAYTLTLLLGHN